MKLGEIVDQALGSDVPVEFVAFDGSKAGQIGAPIRLEVKSQRAIDLFMSHPGQIGLVRAYAEGELEIYGDLVETLRVLSNARYTKMGLTDKLKLGAGLAPEAVKRVNLKRAFQLNADEKIQRGRRHSKKRDAEAISHHYDVSNTFYEMLLGPSMAYTCAAFPTDGATLEQAQEEKFDLVCRKLDLQPGMKLLDVGCGWGGMVTHAVENYGVEAIGVTLSEQQAGWAQQSIVDRGLTEKAEVRFLDYRDVPEGEFDAISSIGLTEHIGEDNYRSYFDFLRSKIKPGARMLNHSITRPNDLGKASYKNSFVNRYIFPDGELTGPAKIVSGATAAGWEMQHEENLRRHYALTLNAWSKNLADNWDKAVEEVGERKARIWKLYLAASEFGFISNRIQLHQFLLTNTTSDGFADIQMRPDFSKK
ncbi:MAG: class I SAM-dependent methyltransferase [Candidatus Nanopelagicales bacterium]